MLFPDVTKSPSSHDVPRHFLEATDNFFIFSVLDSRDAKTAERRLIGKDFKSLAAFAVEHGEEKGRMLSPYVFTHRGKKSGKDFFMAQLLGLDIDANISVDGWISKYGYLKQLVLATQSHGMLRHGKPGDSFRVFLMLDRPIVSLAELVATLRVVKDSFGEDLDQKCFDTARKFFYCNPKFHPLFVNETGATFKVESPTREDIIVAEQIAAGVTSERLTGFNAAKELYNQINILSRDAHWTNLASGADPLRTMKKRRNSFLLLGRGDTPIFNWYPSADASFINSFVKTNVRGVERTIAKRAVFTGLTARHQGLLFIDLVSPEKGGCRAYREADFRWLPHLMTKHPGGWRLWFAAKDWEVRATVRTLVRDVQALGLYELYSIGPGSLDWKASVTVIPTEIAALKAAAASSAGFPTLPSPSLIAASPEFRKARRAAAARLRRAETAKTKLLKETADKVVSVDFSPKTKKKLEEEGNREVASPPSPKPSSVKTTPSASRAARIFKFAYRGRLPEKLTADLRSPHKDAIIRVILGHPSLRAGLIAADKGREFKLNIYATAEAATLFGRRVTATMVSRFIRRLVDCGLIEVATASYKIREESKGYRATELLGNIMAEVASFYAEGFVATRRKRPNPMSGLPGPRDGHYGRWVLWVTRFYDSREDFIADLTATHGAFLEAKPGRLDEAEAAWLAHCRRQDRKSIEAAAD